MRVTITQRYWPKVAVVITVATALLVTMSVPISASTDATRSPNSTMASRSAIPLNTRLTTVAFLNTLRGYGVFNVLGSVACSDRVGLTTNGGATFSPPVSVVSWPCAHDAPASALAFDDHGDGFFYGPKLFITHNNGATWSTSSQHGAVLSVEALGNSIWMLETTHAVSPSSSSNSKVALRLLSSTNGGRTWSELPTPRGAEVRRANAGGSGWLVRTSQTSAYLASSPANHLGVPQGSTPLWFTANAGNTWSSRTIPCAGFYPDMALSVAPDGTLFDVCAGEPSAGNQLKETLRSTNMGRTWTVRSKCHMSSANALRCTPGSQFSGYLGEIDAVSSRTVYLVGERSSLMVSRNGGISWTVVPPRLGGDAGGTVQAIFFTPSTGIVLGDNDRDNELPTLWSTTNSGAHWSVRKPQFS
jgi:hypothetical protein